MKPTKALIQQRVEDVLQIRLDGATFVQVWRYVADKEAANEPPWAVPEGGAPLSRRSIERYIQRADKLMAETTREGRMRAIRRHLAQRQNLYARSVNAG